MKNVLEAAMRNKKDITFLPPDGDIRTGEGKNSHHLRGLQGSSLLGGERGSHESRK